MYVDKRMTDNGQEGANKQFTMNARIVANWTRILDACLPNLTLSTRYRQNAHLMRGRDVELGFLSLYCASGIQERDAGNDDCMGKQ